MRVSVFGLGYVGCVTAACLADAGHNIIGVDIDPHKVDCVNHGKAPFFERGLTELVAKNLKAGRLRAVHDDADAVQNSDVALVFVGTPSDRDGSVKLDALRNVFRSIGTQLRNRHSYFVVALRSTVLPNLIENELLPLVASTSGKKIPSDIGFVCNPEFLREGSAIEDFNHAPLTLIGQMDAKAGDIIADLYANVRARVVHTDIRTASLVKYASNAFHSLKVVFANEIGNLASELSADGRELMEIFCQDTILNISDRYLQPGFPFGGSCLPKDLRALLSESQRRHLKLPVLESVLPSNELQLRSCIRMVADLGKKKLGLVGLTFKPGTDDLRESPAVEFAETLLGKGYELKIFEASISPGSIYGSNLRFIEQSIPHIWKLLTADFEQVVRETEVVVLMAPLEAHMRPALRLFRPGQICFDFVHALTPDDLPAGSYRSLTQPSKPEYK